MTRTLCGLVLLFAIGYSKSESPTAPTASEPPTQSGPPVITLNLNVHAASCAPATPPSTQPAFSGATIVRQTDTTLTASWPVDSRTLYANFVLENNVWALCSWDIADI